MKTNSTRSNSSIRQESLFPACTKLDPPVPQASSPRSSKLIIVALCSLSTALTSMAQETSWTNFPLGDWFISGNWSGGVPAPGTDTWITNGGTALINQPAVAGDLRVGGIKNTSGALLLSRIGSNAPGTLAVPTLRVGEGGGPGTGAGAAGTLDVTNGAQVLAYTWIGFPFNLRQGFTAIGIGSQATGIVTVKHAGSLLDTSGLTVGSGTSNGTLKVENGGHVQSADSVLASDSGSRGSVTVTGAGSRWDVWYDLAIGSGGVGSLLISNGAAVNGRGATIGTFAGSNGTVSVSGNGSIWDNDGSLYVGGRDREVQGQPALNGGSGSLRILAGGRVRASRVKFFNNGILEVDNGSSSVAGLQVFGGDDELGPGGTLGDMVVGLMTGGRMEISGGGTVESHRGFIGMNPGADGAVTVSGAGSRWDCTGSIWSGNGGVGSLEITNGGIVTSAGHGYLGFATNTSGYVNVSGAGSTLSIAGDLYVGGNAAAAGGSGTLSIASGGIVSATTARLHQGAYLDLGADPTLNASLTVTGGAIEAGADTTFTNSFTVEEGGLNVFSGTHSAIFSGQIAGSGSLTKQSGGFTRPQPGTLTLTGASSYSGVTSVFAGKFLVDGSITSAVTVFSGGTLGGEGAVGSVTVNAGGVVAPGDPDAPPAARVQPRGAGAAGNSPGRLTVNGDYTQKSGGILNIEIGGNTPGAGGYDQLVVTGTATLDGTLNLILANGFRPAPGDTFSILTSNSETGNFTTINSPGFTVTSAVSGSEITVTVTAIDPLLQILAMARNGENISITFDAIAAQTYRLQRNFTLSPLTWDDVSGDYTPAANGPGEMVDPGGANFPRAFYRVILVP